MQANWWMIGVLVVLTCVAAWLGRTWFHRWFNPLTLYSTIWGFCLCNYELNLIQYERISLLAWTYIFTGWISLYLGAAVAIVLFTGRKVSIPRLQPYDLRQLKKGLVLCILVGALSLADQLRFVAREFGGLLTAVMLNAGDIYRVKVAGDLTIFPYVGAFSLVACSLAGIYTARQGRLTFLGGLPFIIVALQDLFAMSRLELGIAAVLFLASYVHTPKRTKIKFTRWQKGLALVLGSVALGGAFVAVSSVRGLGVDFPGITPEMDKISEYVPVFPSIYSNFSASPVAFSMYLSSPEDTRNGRWGEYTFAPPLRLLSKTGLVRGVDRYEENYDTPVPTNINTYLKNVHSDFGALGILFFPFFLGFATSALAFRSEQKGRTISPVVVGHLYVILVFSFAFNLMMLGAWYVSLACGTLVALAIDWAKVNVRAPEVLRAGNAVSA